MKPLSCRRRPGGGRWLVALAGAALLAAAPGAAASPAPGLFDQLFGTDPAAERAGSTGDGLALPDLFVDSQRIAEALPLHDTGPAADRCIAIDALLDALELAHTRSADGDISIVLPAPGRTVRIPRALLHAAPGGDCLPLAAVSAHLPVALAYDPESQRLLLTASAPLPVLARLARAERQSRLRPETERPAYPLAPRPDAVARIWSADMALGLRSAPDRRDASGTIIAAGEILGLGARVNLSLSGRQPVRAGVVLAEARDTPTLLGPLGARSLVMGDLTSPAQPLIADTVTGRGLILSSRLPWRADLVDEITLSGPLAPGWEAELWHENRLVAFTRTADAAGQWQFPDLAVRLGENRWTVRLFGPHGEQDERVFTRLVGSAMNPENEIDYTVGVVDGSRGVLAAAPMRAAAGAAAFASIGVGLVPDLTARLDLHAPLAGRPAAALGLHGSTAGLLWAASAARDSGGSAGLALRLARRFGAQDLVLDLARHGRDARPWQAQQVRDFAGLAALNLQGRVPMGRLSLPWQLRLQSADLRTGGRQQLAAARLSLPFPHWQTNAALSLTRQARAGWQGRAALGLAAEWGKLRLRAGLDTTLGRRWRVAGVTLSSTRPLAGGTVNVDLGWQVGNGAVTGGIAFNHRVGPVGLSAGLAGGTDGWRCGLTLVTGFWQASGRWHAAPAGLARSGAVLADLFIDENENGARDPGEAGVSGGRFVAAAALRSEATGTDGTVLIRGLPAGPSFDLETQLASLDDFTLRPARSGDRLSLRPGEVRRLPVPLRRTGSIEVQVRLATGESPIPRSGVVVTLRDTAGRQVVQRETDFAGTVLFDGLPLGRWQVEAAGQSLAGIDLSVARPERAVTLDIPTAPDGRPARADDRAPRLALLTGLAASDL